jgi:DNA-binding transcriptional LysR family regulator
VSTSPIKQGASPPTRRPTLEGVTIHQIRCFDAVVTEGGFQAAATKLGRSHPAVFSAVKSLEDQLGFALLDRHGYRVALTGPGRAFHQRARVFLHELGILHGHAAQLAEGEEGELRIVIGDLCPLREVLGLLRRFFDDCPGTQLHLHFEALAGPAERLFDGDADLILHHVDKADTRLEFVDLCAVRLVPVVAPGFLRFPVSRKIAPRDMRDYVQCVIRDSARHSPQRSYHLIEGAQSWTVSDQLMKRELILRGMGWGHLPTFLIGEELRAGRLLSIAGKHLPGATAEMVAARRRDRPHGPIAGRLWRFIEEQAPGLRAAVDAGGRERAGERRTTRSRASRSRRD